MNSSTLRHDILPALLAGTARVPLQSDANPVDLLSLAGQALRFELPPALRKYAIDDPIPDDRAILPEALRRPLLRLLQAKPGAPVLRTLARAFDKLRLRPHPFDLPQLESFVRAHVEDLGPTARHWASRNKSDAGTHAYFDEEKLTADNWTTATLARRVIFLEQLRRDDPAVARALLEAAWPNEPADARFRLLDVLQTNLTLDDEPFLLTLEKDRAQRVRDLVARLRSRLGSGAQNPALKAALDRLQRSQSGLLRKRDVLKLDIPANLKDAAIDPWIRATFSDVAIDELAVALQLTEDQIFDAAEKDEHLLFALGVAATTGARFDLLERITALLPDLWAHAFLSGLDDLGRLTQPERQRWAAILVQPYGANLPIEYGYWDWLHRVTAVPLPPSIFARVLDPNFLQRLPSLELAGPAWLELLAAMCPREQRDALRACLAGFEPRFTGTATALLDILNGMENHRARA